MNPRFPHTFKVYRPSKNEDGSIVYDEQGNPTLTEVVLAKVEMTSSGDPVRVAGEFSTTEVTEMPFGYRSSASRNTETAGDVIVADHRGACPMFLTPLYAGDILKIKDYEREYEAVVVKKVVVNWGANIWFNEVRN